MELNDWSAFMIAADQNIKQIEDKLLHKKYSDIHENVRAVKQALDKTEAWVAMQGSKANVDIVDVVGRVLDSMPINDPSRAYLMASMQEILQLRGERQFWLQSGYEIGAKGE